jgi:hypothetical protein
MVGQRGMKLTKKQKTKITGICGDIYEVGHAHGGNAFRGLIPDDGSPDMQRLRKLRKVNIGWGKYCDRLIRLIEKEF